MELSEVRTIIRQELPVMFRTDPDMQQFILDLTRTRYANKGETSDRFESMLAEIKTMRKEQNRKWEENQQDLRTLREEQNRKWEENQQYLRILREEQNRKWEEQNRKWEENQQELRTLREEQNRKWEENQREIRTLHEKNEQLLQEIKRQGSKHESSIGAIGSRWGVRAEETFREALKGILGDSFGVTIEQVTLWDEQGQVFGRPDQVELDVIIKNGLLILAEIKSSLSKNDLYMFWKKVGFYEQVHQRKANRQMVISPMVDRRAQALAVVLGIEVYSYAEEVKDL